LKDALFFWVGKIERGKDFRRGAPLRSIKEQQEGGTLDYFEERRKGTCEGKYQGILGELRGVVEFQRGGNKKSK